MKKSKFTGSQIIAILKQHENGVPVVELAREDGVNAAQYMPEVLNLPVV